MKLYFEDNLDYQRTAVESATGLFRGQEAYISEFATEAQPEIGLNLSSDEEEDHFTIGNSLLLDDFEIERNLRRVQIQNGLPQTEIMNGREFTVEMETGTGKTYVYLRTIFELYKNYRFTKFVIVVPSIAIKEGVYKTFQITQGHFEGLYPKAKGYEYFLYDSSKLGQVRNFATSPNIQIMITTVGAINRKDINNLYKENEDMGDEKPIDLVRATNPIIIVDEPQSVDGGLTGKGRDALAAMRPLCTLRYSATHVDKYNMIYRLDAVDAYQRGLVKQIEVASLRIVGDHNKPYVRLISTKNNSGSITAKIEVDIEKTKRIQRKILTVQDGEDLESVTERSVYEGMRIGTIVCGKDSESIEIIGGKADGQVLLPGNIIGGSDPDEIKRLMIRRTIKEHLDKELVFARNKKPIKVLSLFFIDSVKHYRQYDGDGNPINGKYSIMFEKEYRKLARSSKYQDLFGGLDLSTDVKEVHDGYFSIDKKGWLVESAENTQVNRDNAERAYNLIMREKEKLLSFDTKLKFIFSHSALREGWDNPNIFQICTLRDVNSMRERRQTIGRGLRLCVNQYGERMRDSDINTLTVIATENYKEFAENLQKEIEQDTGIQFGIVEPNQFTSIYVIDENGEASSLGFDLSDRIWQFLHDRNFVDAKGKIQDRLRIALSDGTFGLPEEFTQELIQKYGEEQIEVIELAIQSILRKLAGRLNIKNSDDRRVIHVRGEVLNSKEFRSLWNRIKYKTAYRVEFNNRKLLADCAEAIRKCPEISEARGQFRKADILIEKDGVGVRELDSDSISGYTKVRESDIELPDIITDLQDKTQMTRKSIVKILIESQRLQDFLYNPQQFIDYCSMAINHTKQLALVSGIRYTKIGNSHYYAQELFEQEELRGYLKNMELAKKSVHTHVVYDSGVEQKFSKDLDQNEQVKYYVKLPSWFKVPTPLGSYNPDWAVIVEDGEDDKLYLVVETKGGEWLDDLRRIEKDKVECGKRHFDEIAKDVENPANYILSADVEGMMRYIHSIQRPNRES